jgi:transposase
MSQRYARAESGTRAYGVEPYVHGQIITLIGAISFNQVVTTMTVNGGTNGNVFRTFVDKLLVPQLWSGAYVVADNLPAHKVKGISEAIAA